MYGADVWKYPANDPLMSAVTSNLAGKRHTSPSDLEIRSNEGEPMSDLYEIARPFPPKLVRKAPKGKYGDYVPHATVNERLLSIVGPFSFHVTDPIMENGKVVGCLATLVADIDGRTVSITEVGDVEHPDQASNGANLKNASSDAFKRCCMRLGLGLHLWSGDDYFLDAQLHQITRGDGNGSPMMSDAQTEGISEPGPVAPRDTSPAQAHADAAEEALQTIIDADLIDGIAGDPQAQEKASELWDRIEAADG